MDEDSKSVVSLVVRRKQVNEEAVKMLETILDQVKSGEITDAACLVRFSDGTCGECFAYNDYIQLLGQLAIMEREVIDSGISLRYHSPGIEY